MIHKTQLTLTLLAIFSTTAVQAAPITWGSAFELVDEFDIDLSFGQVVYAVNGGDNTGNEPLMLAPLPSTLTVNVGSTPIDFEGIEAVYGAAASFGQLGFPFESFGDAIDHIPSTGGNVTFTTTDHRTVPNPQVTFDKDLADPIHNLGSRTYNVGTGNANLDSLLASQVFVDSRAIGSGALNLSLNNLNPGQEYQIQLIGPAANSGRISAAIVNDGEGNSVGDLHGFLDLDNDLAPHVTSVIGTFTADNTSQAINVVLDLERNTGISGLILTTNIPEPTSAFLALSALMCGLSIRARS